MEALPAVSARAEGGVAELIVLSTLALVAEDVVGLGGLLEASLRSRVALVAVGVVLECLLAIGLLDLAVAGAALDLEDLVVVALGLGYDRLPSTASPSSFTSVTIESVVRSRPAMDAAFWRAERTTLVGSMMPALNMSV